MGYVRLRSSILTALAAAVLLAGMLAVTAHADTGSGTAVLSFSGADVVSVSENDYASRAPAISWAGVIDGTNDSSLRTVFPTSDGGLLLTGFGDGSANQKTLYLLKLGPDGRKQWDSRLACDYGDVLTWTQVREGADGYLVTVGVGNTKFAALKTDLQGNKVWDKKFSNFCRDPSLYSGDWVSAAYPVADGYVVVGSRPESTDPDVRVPFLIKLDQEGSKELDRQYPHPGFAGHNGIKRVLNTSDGGYAVLSGDTNHTFLLKLDASGDVQWQTRAAEGQLQATDLVERPAGGYVLLGYSDYLQADLYQNDGIFVQVSADGSQVTNRTFRRDHLASLDYLLNARDGGLIAAGNLHEPYAVKTYDEASDNLYVAKFDSSGALQWQKTIVRNNGNYGYRFDTQCTGVGELADGSWAIFGMTYSSPNIYEARLGPEGSGVSALPGNAGGGNLRCLALVLPPVILGATWLGGRRREKSP